jgi:hypothetical protein
MIFYAIAQEIKHARQARESGPPLRLRTSYMKFGVFYELQLPKPWKEGDEHRLFLDALE